MRVQELHSRKEEIIKSSRRLVLIMLKNTLNFMFKLLKKQCFVVKNVPFY